jgi:hypothetical protein
MGAVIIGKNLQGGSNDKAGAVETGGNLASLKIGGSVIGAGGENSGYIFSSSDMGAVTIGGSVIAGRWIRRAISSAAESLAR